MNNLKYYKIINNYYIISPDILLIKNNNNYKRKMDVKSLEVGEKKKSFISSNGDIELPNETYRIFGFLLTYILSILFILVSLAFLIIGIIDLTQGKFKIHNFLVPLVLIVIACIITYFFPFYSSITVDFTNKIVTCRKYQLFFIIRRVVNIEIPNIERVYCEKNYGEGFGKDEKESVDGFNLIFEMKDGSKIIGLEGEIDKDFEMTKVGFFMSKFFQGQADPTAHQIMPESKDEEKKEEE